MPSPTGSRLPRCFDIRCDFPIPHTAIIPTRKDQIGRSLGEFVEENFLSSDIIGERIANAHIGQRLGDWLAEPANAAKAAAATGDSLRGIIEVLDDREVQEGLGRAVEDRIRSTPLAPLAGRAIDALLDGGHHERILNSLLIGLRDFLDEHRSGFRRRLETESPWWVPERIDDRIFAKIYDGVNRFLDDVGNDRTHEVRVSITQRLVALGGRSAKRPCADCQG